MKIFDYELFTGSKGNVLNVGDWLKLIMGVVVVIISTVLGQRVASMIENAVPGNQTKISPFVTKQQTATAVTPVTVVQRV